MLFNRRKVLRASRTQAVRTLEVHDPGHLGFNYQLRLSNRKSIGVQVRNGQVRLSGPHHMTQHEMQLWLETKIDWVRDKLAAQRKQLQQVSARGFTTGEAWPLMGRSFELSIQQGKTTLVEADADVLQITLSRRNRKPAADQVKQALIQWYTLQAMTILEEKTRLACRQLGATCNKITLRRTRSKWGHCTPAGVIQYNWLIVQAPETVVDYLVIHECCHLIHLNHSPDYWNLVERLMPDYRVARQWLKENGHLLII